MNSYLLQDNGKDSESLKDENEAKEKEKTNKQATRNREVLGAKQNILIEYIFKITHESAHVRTITSLVHVKPASAVKTKQKKNTFHIIRQRKTQCWKNLGDENN